MRGSLSVLLVTGGIVHPSLLAQAALRTALRDVIDFPIVWHHGVRTIERIGEIAPLCAILYYHEPRLRVVTEPLAEYVANGGTIVAVHGVAASNREDPCFSKLL
jgi:hypothetical protein